MIGAKAPIFYRRIKMSKEINASKNDVVIINLDRPRALRFGHKALKKIAAMTGKDIDAIDFAKIDLNDIEKIMFCGLERDARENNEQLTLEMIEDLLDQADTFKNVVDSLQKAIMREFGITEEPQEASQEKN
jgi:hypothetical protein